MNFWTFILITYCAFSVGTFAIYMTNAIEIKHKIRRKVPNYDELVGENSFFVKLSSLLVLVCVSIIPLLHCLLFFYVLGHYDQMAENTINKKLAELDKGV